MPPTSLRHPQPPARAMFRQFYWLSCPSEKREIYLKKLLRALALAESEALLVGLTPLLQLPAQNPRQLQRYLGTEQRLILFDAHQSFHPNAFAQITGTLVGGGCFILLTPPLLAWPESADLETQAVARGSQPARSGPSAFLKHLSQQLLAATQVAEMIGFTSVPEDALELRYLPVPENPWLSGASVPAPYLTEEQAQLVSRLTQLWRSERSVAVISADRGRGKSSSLGLALRTQQAENWQVQVTAPEAAAVGALFAMLADAQTQVQYLTPGQLLQAHQSADLLIIDEAAALPVSFLSTCLQRYPRVVFATTLKGYEGNGRGFALRFRQELQKVAPQFQEWTLQQPIRWPAGDPFEALYHQLLLLDAQPADVLQAAPIEWQDLSYLALAPEDLCQDSATLREIFGLLIAAHYRTTPNDLRLLLDSPGMQIRVLRNPQQQILATLWLAPEGGIEPELAQAIWQGRRRPKGDLISQILIAQEGWQEAASWRGWRVMRIAVHPEAQRQGLGFRLLQAMEQEAKALSLDYVATSFAAEVGVVAFWQAAAYAPLRLGEQQDAVTGSWPLLMFKPLQLHLNTWLPQAQERLTQYLRLRLAKGEVLPSYLIRAALAARYAPTPLSQQTLERLAGFAWAERGLESSLLELQDWLIALLGQEGRVHSSCLSVHPLAEPLTDSAVPTSSLKCFSDQDWELMLNRLLRLQTAAQVHLSQGLGPKQQVERLRHCVAETLSNLIRHAESATKTCV
ncbi:GNAT family N-acetyltransferase [Nitrincola tapanii]|uniref:GNAT family N-acetyltransferase n=1 Tax=Nitrincola tapanii TaxID=1708751 RepID=UPI00135CE7E6|nr:GNAT family N-acetyltransferase [Nitrincola tapanii]